MSIDTSAMKVVGPSSALPAVQSETDTMNAMIERVARDTSVDIDRLERLLAMKERAELRAAEAAFNDAMSLAQGEMSPIARDSNNPQTKSKYASYHAVDKAIRPIYTKHGFRVSFDEEEIAAADMVRIVAFVTRGMHRERYHYDSPIVSKGLRGNEMMTATHARASADSYAKRYLMGRIWNLSTGEDDDGNAAGKTSENYTPPAGSISAAQVEELRMYLEDKGASERAFLGWAKQKRLEDIPDDQFESCKTAILKFKSY